MGCVPVVRGKDESPRPLSTGTVQRGPLCFIAKNADSSSETNMNCFYTLSLKKKVCLVENKITQLSQLQVYHPLMYRIIEDTGSLRGSQDWRGQNKAQFSFRKFIA